jgi:hypothetical protein
MLEQGWGAEPSQTGIITVHAGQGVGGARRAGVREEKFKGSGFQCEYRGKVSGSGNWEIQRDESRDTTRRQGGWADLSCNRVVSKEEI